MPCLRRCLWIAIAVILFPFVLHAQEAQSEADRSRQLLRNQLEIKLKEYEAMMGGDADEDLGEQILVKRKPKPWNITLSSDLGSFYTSNALSSEANPQADFATTHNDVLTATYRLTDELTFTGTGRYSLFRYHRLGSQDFDAYNGGGNLSYSLPYEVTVSTGLQWTSIYSQPIDDAVYDEFDWSIGFVKVAPLTFAQWVKDKSAIFVGYQTDVRVANPSDFDKTEYSPYVGMSYLLHPQVVAQMLYRWQFQEYARGTRKDFNDTFSTNVGWTPYSWLNVSTFFSYTHNDSTVEIRDYDTWNSGVNVRCFWRF
jgi:hypothetical protein